MKGTRYIGLSALIVSMSPCHAQGFNLAHHNQNMLGASGRSIFEQPDGYLMFSVQWSLDTTHSALYITKFGLEGGYVSERVHSIGRDTDPGIMDPVAVLEQGGFVSGMTFFGNGQPNKTYLYRFNENGDTLWTRFLKEDTTLGINSGTRHILQLSDHGFLHSGWCSVTGGAACVMRLDSSGTVLWERIYPPCSYIFNATPTNDGNFILGSRITDYPDQGVIMKIDSLGEPIWTRRFGGHAITGGRPVIELDDGSIFSIGAWEPLSTPLSSEMQYGSLYKFSSSGAPIWRKDYFYGWKAGMAHIHSALDGNYWLIGAGYNEDYTIVQSYILKVDQSGDSLWMRKYWHFDSYEAWSSIYGATPTSDGGLVMTGLAKQGELDPQPFLASMWLLKVDEHGCVIPGCHTVGVSEYAADLNQYFSVWPNPVVAGSLINFSFEPPDGFTATSELRAVLLDALGREVRSRSYSNSDPQFILESDGLPHGIYHLHLTDQRSWLAGAKVVIE